MVSYHNMAKRLTSNTVTNATVNQNIAKKFEYNTTMASVNQKIATVTQNIAKKSETKNS